MAIYKNGKKLADIIVNGQKISQIFHRGGVIYSSGPKIVSFHDGTDVELAAMLNAHYAGQINISDYWKVGDTRVVHINATNSGTRDHVAQDMTMVIYGFDHDDLTTPINGKIKAAVSVGFREIMGKEGTAEAEYYSGLSRTSIEDTENYSNASLKSWLNSKLLNALPSTFGSLIKEVNKKNLSRHSSTTGSPLITEEKIWLLSYPEVFGQSINSNYISGKSVGEWEGVQYEYLKNANNRKKQVNNNGTVGAKPYAYFLRSPSSYNITTPSWGYFWFNVNTNGIAETNASIVVSGIAPAFCL